MYYNDKYEEHVDFCSSRTDVCTLCLKSIPLKYFDIHYEEC